jgi:hypothetical protein
MAEESAKVVWVMSAMTTVTPGWKAALSSRLVWSALRM